MTNLDNYTGILLEEIRDQNLALLEAVADMQRYIVQIPVMSSDIDSLKQDVNTIKKVVTDISRQQKDHETRITRLESVRVG